MDDEIEDTLEDEREFANEDIPQPVGPFVVPLVVPLRTPFKAASRLVGLVICVIRFVGVAEIFAGGTLLMFEVVSLVVFTDNLERGKAIRLEVAAKRAAVCSALVAGGLSMVLGGGLLDDADRLSFSLLLLLLLK